MDGRDDKMIIGIAQKAILFLLQTISFNKKN